MSSARTVEEYGPTLVVPASLRSGVASVRGQRSPRSTREVELVRPPTCDAQLIVHVTPGGEVRASAAGPSTFAKYRLIVPGPFYIQLVFQPDVARSVFGIPLHELSDRVVDLEELWGPSAREVIDRVATRCDQPQAAVRAVEPLLADRVRAGAAVRGARLARRAAEVLRSPAATNVRELADDLGVSERSLRQAFLDHIGTSPKRFARIARVLRVVAGAGRASWADLAVEHAFFDQPHLNAEFRALLGVSPGQWAAGQLPFVRRVA